MLAPVVLGLVAGGLDLTFYRAQSAAIQDSVDSAALAAVREASLKGWDSKVATAVAETIARTNYSTHHTSEIHYEVDTKVDKKNRRVTVEITQDHYPYFFSSLFPSPQVFATATAAAAGSTNICVIGLDGTRSQTIGMNDSSIMTAPNCAVYSNSQAIDGMAAVKKSSMNTDLACSAGGYLGTAVNFSSTPLTDCPTIDDPLAKRPAPSVAPCRETSLEIKGKGGSQRLMPGTYCNGLTIKANASVTLDPGIYIIKDGPLTLAANASLFGRGVGFYFVGSGSAFSLESGSTVDLEAAKAGALAGLLFFQDRSSPEANFILRSNKASNLLGTIYLPNGNFIIDTNAKVADTSAYTTIVARSLTLKRKPNVVLNTNYDGTDVPVPTGLGPTKGDVRLLN